MTEKIFSGHQPNFLPYMGFFYKMYQADVFVLDDDVQYSNDAYHNTNFIKVNGERFRVTVPVSYEFGMPINKVRICYERNWRKKMLRTISSAYKWAKHLDEGYEMLERHLARKDKMLVDLNVALIKEISERFGIGSKIAVASEDVPTDRKKNERNIYQCKALGCNVYYSGAGGIAYNDEKAYSENGIVLRYTDYKPLEYRQAGRTEFVENLSVIDYIFNCGFVLPESWRRE